MDETTEDRITAQLTSAGDGWRDHLPEGATILHDGDPIYRDSIQVDGNRFYRVEVSGRWYTVGWSNASKQQVYRPTMTEEEHFLSLHSDDDGS